MLQRLVALKHKLVAHEQLQHAYSDDLTRQTVSAHQSITHEQIVGALNAPNYKKTALNVRFKVLENWHIMYALM